jgi:hypothetical protein
MEKWVVPRHFELGERSHFAHVRISDKNDHSEIPRSAPLKVCHSERSEVLEI